MNPNKRPKIFLGVRLKAVDKKYCQILDAKKTGPQIYASGAKKMIIWKSRTK